VSHEGRLFEHPLPELLVKLRRSKATVHIELGATLANPTVSIKLEHGLIQSVATKDAPAASFEDALKGLKAIDASTLKQAKIRLQQMIGLSLDQVLVEMGGIDPKVLEKARQRQIQGDLETAMAGMDKLRRFRIAPSEVMGRIGVEPAQLMALLILDAGHPARTRNLVLELRAVEVRDGVSHQRLRDRFGLTRNDMVVLRLLSVPRRTSELLELDGLEGIRTARLVRAMRLFGAVLGTDANRAKAVVPVELRRIQKEVKTVEVTSNRRITLDDMPVPARDQKLLKDVENLIGLDFFTLFDLDTETTKKEVNQSFLNLAQTWHPDRVQGRHPRLVAAITKLFAKLNNARDTLEDKVLRETYAAHLKQNSGRQFRNQEISPEASRLECQKAKVLMRKKDFWSAGLHLKRAGQLDPKNKQVGALDLLCQIRDPKTDQKQRIHCLEEAGKEYPNEAELVFERAMEHFNRKNFSMAEELLVETLDLRPHHRDAERYMKLTKMRLTQSTPPKADKSTKKKGFFGS
jgi:tetratricopeptide (TPR) repeat protein